MNSQHIGNIFIISAASGTGKTTLVSRLTHHYDTIRVAVSHTTRPPREGEQHGKQYYFVSPEKFMQLVGDGCFWNTRKYLAIIMAQVCWKSVN